MRRILSLLMTAALPLAAAAFLSAEPAQASGMPAGPTRWEAGNTCWLDFDVGGGWFCGLRGVCAGEQGLRCGTQIQVDVPPPYGTSVPASKYVAIDSSGWIYLVGNDNKIYVEGGNDAAPFSLFSKQPPTACINKLVATRHNGARVLLVLGCDAAKTVYRYLNGTWSIVFVGAKDISVGTTSAAGVEAFYVLSASGHRPLYFSAPNSDFILAATRINEWGAWTTDVKFGAPSNMTLQVARIGGIVAFLGGALQACGGDVGLAPSLFWNWGFNKAHGPDPGGCSSLKLPPTGWNPQGSMPIVDKVVDGSRGPGGSPGNGWIWIHTNNLRVYALTTR